MNIYKPGYKISNPVNVQGDVYEGNLNMENQVIGPFPLESNTIEITVTYRETAA